MGNSFVTTFNIVPSYELLHPGKSCLEEKLIYRDELDKKAPKKKAEKKSYCSVDGKDSKKKSYGCVPSNEVIRVKLKMTKQEAARMLSKCKDGGFLDFKDVASELVHLPPNRVSVVSHEARFCPVLENIPEDL